MNFESDFKEFSNFEKCELEVESSFFWGLTKDYFRMTTSGPKEIEPPEKEESEPTWDPTWKDIYISTIKAGGLLLTGIIIIRLCYAVFIC